MRLWRGGCAATGASIRPGTDAVGAADVLMLMLRLMLMMLMLMLQKKTTPTRCWRNCNADGRSSNYAQGVFAVVNKPVLLPWETKLALECGRQ